MKLNSALAQRMTIFGQPRQMHRHQRRGSAEFHREIAIADRVHRVLRELRLAFRVHEAELLRATNSRSSGKVEPAIAPLPSGQTLTR